MQKRYITFLNHIFYFILSFLLLTLWLFKENGGKFFLFWSIVNFVSIIILLTFGKKYYRTIKEAAEKCNREDEKWYCLLCVYIPLCNTIHAGLVLVDFIHDKIKYLRKI